ANAPSARSSHTAVWTGSEMIVWGGTFYPSDYFNTGGRYDPAANTWAATNTGNAPSAPGTHTAGSNEGDMDGWGGETGWPRHYNGGRYAPVTDTWTATTTVNAPSARQWHTAVSTGNEMIVWGGSPDIPPTPSNTGGRYDPAADAWTATSTDNAPSARRSHTG